MAGDCKEILNTIPDPRTTIFMPYLHLIDLPYIYRWEFIGDGQSTDRTTPLLYDDQECICVDYAHNPNVGKPMKTFTHVIPFLGSNKDMTDMASTVSPRFSVHTCISQCVVAPN